MKVLIAGAGAIGGWLGAKLCAAQHDVTLLGREALATAVAQDGLQITGLTEMTQHPRVITEPEGQYDVIFVTAKAHATAAMAPDVASMLAEGGAVISLQNGLGNVECLGLHIPEHQIGVALTSHGVTAEAPGKLRHAGLGMFKIGPSPDQVWTQALDRAASVVEAANIPVERVDEMLGHMWLKAAVNAGLNPVCALHEIRNGEIQPHMTAARSLVDEVYSLSRAAGVRLPTSPITAFEKTVAQTAENVCSMLQDVRAGRPTEIEQITGYFVRLARRLGYPLFENEAVYQRLKDLERSYLGEQADALTVAAAQAFVWG